MKCGNLLVMGDGVVQGRLIINGVPYQHTYSEALIGTLGTGVTLKELHYRVVGNAIIAHFKLNMSTTSTANVSRTLISGMYFADGKGGNRATATNFMVNSHIIGGFNGDCWFSGNAVVLSPFVNIPANTDIVLHINFYLGNIAW